MERDYRSVKYCNIISVSLFKVDNFSECVSIEPIGSDVGGSYALAPEVQDVPGCPCQRSENSVTNWSKETGKLRGQRPAACTEVPGKRNEHGNGELRIELPIRWSLPCPSMAVQLSRKKNRVAKRRYVTVPKTPTYIVPLLSQSRRCLSQIEHASLGGDHIKH